MMDRRKVVSAGAVILGLLLPFARDAGASGGRAAISDLAHEDFRVRVTAALTAGKLKPEGAKQALLSRLGDPHPAVRAAVAAALGALGDASVVPDLERRMREEAKPNVRAQLRASVDSLQKPGNRTSNIRYVADFGTIRSRVPALGVNVVEVVRKAGETHRDELNGGVFASASDGLLGEEARKKLPQLTLDASLVSLKESREGRGLAVRAEVELTVRHKQSLVGSVSGSATASGPPMQREKLLRDAVDAAVAGALRGVRPGLVVAQR